MREPLAIYATALRRAAAGGGARLHLVGPGGTTVRRVDPAIWCGDLRPGEGRWRHALLVDGNIGIGGDPARLLRRCRQLVGTAGALLVEVEPPGVASWRGELALADGVLVSTTFPWAFVGADALAALAATAALRVLERWTEAKRWFATLGAA